jgi:3-phosphoshikimate 1-carboxyvinyltransferase
LPHQTNFLLSKQISINPKTQLTGVAKCLPASKSISNRVLIMNALGNNKSVLHNLSDANDTQLMIRLINSPANLIDVEDAGTTMRFLTAYFSVTNQHKTITGTERMQERPIGILVDALRLLGVTVSYTNKEGFPPLTTGGFNGQKTNSVSIRGDVSSQYISALMMIAPLLPNGLTIELTGKVGSRPYIEMTASLMRKFGAVCSFTDNTISIERRAYQSTELFVESDWSGASYWFSFAALSESANIALPHLSLDSLQGDRVIVDIMKPLGVAATMDGGLLRLTKAEPQQQLSWDFTHCPDLAQTVAVVCAAKGITGTFTGLESLRIKETDRIAALQRELRKIGGDLIETGSQWTLKPSTKLPASATFETYKDHRMAMAFAPLATRMEVIIDDASVVRKSYPRFWDDIESFGFTLNR